MDVSGNLFFLPEDLTQVPLPWHTRAPLGLRSGTSVHVALVESLVESERETGTPLAVAPGVPLLRPPDLLISVLDPNAWDRTRRLIGSAQDGPGLLHRLLKNIQAANRGEKFINVELGESFTVPGRCVVGQMRHHRSTLFITHQPFEQAQQTLDKFAEESRYDLRELPSSAAHLKLYLGETNVTSGLLHLDKDWRNEARKLFVTSLVDESNLSVEEAKKRSELFDFDVAFALADLDARAIRLTFPLKGARRLQTLHTDEPNTAIKVTELLDRDYSILGGILAKADASSAALYLVVEPMPGKAPLDESRFASLNRENDFRKCIVSNPCDYRDLLHEKIDIEEIARQLRGELRQYGNAFENFVVDFVQDEVPKAKRRKPRRTFSIELCTQARSDCHFQALEMIRQIGLALDDQPIKFDKLNQANPTLTERMGRLLSADACIFIIWKRDANHTTNPEMNPMWNAILHSMFASSRSLMLIEGSEAEVAKQLVETRALLGDSANLTIRSFEWSDDHVEAARRDHKNPTQEKWTELLLRQNSLYVQLLDWYHKFYK